MTQSPNIFPSLTYTDAPAAIEWLCRVLGFKQRLTVPGEQGTIRHAELSFGSGVIMLSSPRPDQGRQSPEALGGVNQLLSLYVEDPDAHHALALAAGAEIIDSPKDEPHAARGYMLSDPEEHLWYFGNCVPGAHWD